MRRRKGFTILEVVTTIAIIAILAAASLPVVANYIVRAAQSARYESARTLFMAAQTSLTNLYAGGSSQTPVAFVDLSAISPAIGEEELTQNRHHIGYLVLDLEEQDRENNALYALIAPYTADKTILQGAILLEYNTLNGNVLSLFYSDVTSSLGYGSGDYNVSVRDEQTLRANRTGYYGVEGTGAIDAQTAIGDISAQLVDYTGDQAGNDINGGKNYGLLTLECQLPENRAAGDTYEILLKPATGMETTLQLTDRKVAGSDTLSLEEISANLTLENALAKPFKQTLADGSVRNLVAYIENQGETQILVLILDCAYPGLGIAENYPSIQPGSLLATFTVHKGALTKTANSQKCNAYFADERIEGDHTTYQVSSVRHLHNIRYKAAADFEQVRDIAVTDYKGSPLLWQPISDTANQVDNGFKGSYTGLSEGDDGEKVNYQITDLTVNEAWAGLFAAISEDGRVEQVTLSYSEDYRQAYRQADSAQQEKYYINGASLAGGIAARNEGRITDCTVTGRVRALAQDGSAGGIAGSNRENADISGCMSAADITAHLNAGGIAGYSAGDISYCEVGTASAVDEQGETILAGTPYFGATGQRTEVEYDPDGAEVANNVYTVRAEGSSAAAGGIAGQVEQGDILYCVNAAQIVAEGEEGSAGGIAGYTAGQTLKIALSYNAGDVRADFAAGGIAGVNYGEVNGCYNTGLINAQTEYRKFTDQDTAAAYVFSEDLQPQAWSGGLVGVNYYQLYDSYNAQYVGNLYGGVVGLNLGEIGQCVFLNNMHNRTNESYVSTQKETAKLNGVEIVNHDTLRTMNLGAFTANEGANGVGAYEYRYPYLAVSNSDCQLGSAFHRTPYQPVIEDIGRVRAVQREDGMLEVHFLFRAEQADLVLKTDEGDVRFPISSASREKAEMKAYAYGDDYMVNMWWADADGNACDGYAIRLDQNSPDYTAGYLYEFVLFIDWEQKDPDFAALPDDANLCTGYLYEYGQGAQASAVPIAIGNRVQKPASKPAGDMVIIEQSGDKTIQVSFFLPQSLRTYDPSAPSLKEITFAICYEKNGKVDYLNLKPAYLAAYQTDDLKDALANAGVLNPEQGNASRYPFYIREHSFYDGYDQYTVVLLWDEIGNQGYNGLRDGAFYVRLTYSSWDGAYQEFESKQCDGVQK